MYKYVEPEVAGGLGEMTRIDSSIHPPIVSELHFEFEGWLGDDLIETFPCFIFSQRLKEKIQRCKLTGIEFDILQISKAEIFLELYPEKELPNFFWGKIIGQPFKDDFFLGSDYRLIVSESALDVLREFNLNNAVIEDLVEIK